MITVERESKTVHILEGFSPPGPSVGDLNLYEMIKNIRKDAVKRLPDEEIDGRNAIVFRVDVKELPKSRKQQRGKSGSILAPSFRFDWKLPRKTRTENRSDA